MSITKEQFLSHIEIENFNAILNEINKHGSSLDQHKFSTWFKECYFTSKTPINWINLLIYLNNSDQSAFKAPSYMVGILNSLLMSVKPTHKSSSHDLDEFSLFETEQHEEAVEDKEIHASNISRCAPLLKFVLNQLVSAKNNNLMSNYLPAFNGIILPNDTHKSLLDVIETMNPIDKNDVYSIMVDLYITNPKSLYDASIFNAEIFSNLKSATSDPTKLWFLNTIESIFSTSIKNDAQKLCAFLIDNENNEINKSLIKHIGPFNLFKLKRSSTLSYNNVAKLRELLKGDTTASINLEGLLLNNSDKEILNFTNAMSKFLNGFGNINYLDGLLTCAQTHSRKKYTFDPVVLEDNNGFEELLSQIKSRNITMRVRFIMTGSHWISGELQFNKDGEAKLAIYDSLGTTIKSGIHLLQHSTLETMDIYNKIFPQNLIYFCNTKRQNASNCCAVFSLFDMIHSFTIPNHTHVDTFDYYDMQRNQAKKTKIQNTEQLNIQLCDLPLSLLRATQSFTTIDRITTDSDQSLLEQPINKRGDKFMHSANLFSKSFSPTSSKLVNYRMDYELEKMAKRNAAYYLSHDATTIQAESEQFTLKGFINKMDKTTEERKKFF